MMGKKKSTFLMCTNLLVATSAMAVSREACAFVDGPSIASRQVTVSDTVSMGKIVPIGDDEAQIATESPDGSWIVVLHKKADVVADVVLETLLAYRSSDLSSYVGNKSEIVPPQAVVVARIPITRDDAGVSSVHWVSKSEISFIAQGQNGLKQGYIADLISRQVRQITHSTTDVEAFTQAAGVALWYRRAREISPNPVAAVVIDHASVGEAIFGQSAHEEPLELVLSRSDGTNIKIGPTVRIAQPQVWISPDGRYALTLSPAVNAPTEWRAYTVRSPEWAWTPDRARSDPTSVDLEYRLRFQVINMSTGGIKPLLNAPYAFASFAVAPTAVMWNLSRKSVVISNTWLPLAGIADASELTRRMRSPAIVEISLENGTLSPVMFEPDGILRSDGVAARNQINAISLSPSNDALYVESQIHNRRYMRERYVRRKNNGWILESRDIKPGLRNPGVVVSTRQALNQRPILFVTGSACRCSKMLLDPSPSANQLAFGRVEEVSWSAPSNAVWHGLLLRPADYRAEIKYPVVLQTHGYTPGQFLIDGPGIDSGTAFAAQALAAQGFMVLQIQDPPESAATNDEREAALTAEGYRAAIRMLVHRKDIDPGRIGITAFSRTGLAVPLLLAKNPGLIKAAVIADTGWWSYVGELFYGQNSLNDQAIRLQGGWTIGRDPAWWFQNSPLYELSKSGTSIRLEATGGAPMVLGLWEYFALLRSKDRPVDFIAYPSGSHNLQKPSERVSSQQGAVDWYAFWLRGCELDAEERPEQYARWRALRPSSEMPKTCESELGL